MDIYEKDVSLLKNKYFNEDGPLVIAYDITNKCNFKCLHCYNDSGKGKCDELTDEEAINVMHQVAELKPIVICFCGGEPLMRSDLILKCLPIVSNHVSACNMVSNGYLLTQELANNLKSAGLNAIQFSLDGINDMQHDTFRGVKGSFERVLQAIIYAKRAGLGVDISISPNKLNCAYISKYIDFCFSLGVRAVRSMPLIPMGRGGKINHLILSSDEYVTYQQAIQLKIEEYKFKDLSIEWGDPVDHLHRMPTNSRAGMKTYSLEIKANGDIGPSTYFPIIFGNIRKHSIKEYWDAGFDNVWGHKRYLEYLDGIFTTQGIGNFMPELKDKIIDLELIK